ncbi:MAG: hypothetical protein QXE78_10085 [Nitrososphaeria archaeon]
MLLYDSVKVGASVEEIDTPALLIDLDALEKNIRLVSEYYKSKKGSLYPIRRATGCL